MSTERILRHRKATGLFLETLAMDAEARKAFLERLGTEDAALKQEVESLLDHHESRTIMRPGEDPWRDGLRALGPVRDPGSSGSGSTGSAFSRFIGGPGRRAGAGLTLAGALVVLGFWAHDRVEGALLSIRADELRTAVEANVTSLRAWVEQERFIAERYAADPRVRQAIRQLVALAHARGTVDSTLAETDAYRALDAFFAGTATPQRRAGVAIVDVRGRLIFVTGPEPLGLRLTPLGFGLVGGALAGRSVFYPPTRNGDALEGGNAYGSMYAGVLAPVRAPDGDEIIAVLSNALHVPTHFTAVIDMARVGATGETYAFRDDGVMVSRSRFDEALRGRGFVMSADDSLQVPGWDRGSALNLHIRDPGGDVLRGYDPGRPVSARPLTALAERAIASRLATDTVSQRGVLLKPYRNYRGAEVIGAWWWLRDLGIGVAAEIEVAEAFAPLTYLRVTGGVLFALLLVFVAATLYSSVSLARLRRRFGRLRQLGQYTLVDELGEGGMGKVYLAQHAMLKRPTAVKVISEGQVSGESLARFEREVQLASQLTHANTIEVYDYGRTPDGVFYYAMEYLPGISLAELVSAEGAVPEARAIAILRQVCASLSEAHHLGMVHRDIKPRNIMLCQRGGQADVVKVLDFGLAKRVIDPDTMGLTGPARIGGTPLYMAPERIEAPETVDHRVDIYAVGAVAYYLVTGRHLFAYQDELDLLYAIVNRMPEPPSDVAEQPITPAFEQLVMRCVAKDPADRPQTVEDLLHGLCAIEPAVPWSPADAEIWWQARQAAGAS